MLNLPNSLTLLRIAFTPVVCWAVLSGHPVSALVWFAIASITDYLDGAIARWRHLESRFGAFVDPIADKILIDATIVVLWMTHSAPWWFAFIVVGRDVCILVGAVIVVTTDITNELPPSKWGKASTLAQMLLAGTWLLQDVIPPFPLDWPIIILLAISTVLTIGSWLHYTWGGIRLYRNAKAGAVRRLA